MCCCVPRRIHRHSISITPGLWELAAPDKEQPTVPQSGSLSATDLETGAGSAPSNRKRKDPLAVPDALACPSESQVARCGREVRISNEGFISDQSWNDVNLVFMETTASKLFILPKWNIRNIGYISYS